MRIKYLGHSSFLIKTEQGSILIDPLVDMSGEYASLEKFQGDNLCAIFVTHAHNDHLGSAVEISRLTGAPIVSVFELGNFFMANGVNAIPVGLGGKIDFPFFSATLVPAQHTSSLNGQYMGVACGVVLNIDGKNFYHAGDTSLSAEMKMIADYYKPTISMLPIGGHFTMGIDEACYAAKILGSEFIIPMHYNTFPPIEVDINQFIEKISAQEQTPLVMNADEEFEL